MDKQESTVVNIHCITIMSLCLLIQLSGLLISSLISLVPLVDCSLSVTSKKLQITEVSLSDAHFCNCNKGGYMLHMRMSAIST